jgi:hypothetical protein
MTNSKRVGDAKHVTGTGDMRIAYKIVVGNLKIFGRIRHRL